MKFYDIPAMTVSLILDGHIKNVQKNFRTNNTLIRKLTTLLVNYQLEGWKVGRERLGGGYLYI